MLGKGVKELIIAIDGPAGSGKSTIARRVAADLGFHYLDTGAMYRAIAWLALERGVDLEDEKGLADLAIHAPISFSLSGENEAEDRVFIAEHDVTEDIRTPRIDSVVSVVSRPRSVRAALVAQQRRIAAVRDTVMEGRDIGTVVFPHAEVKVFLTASPEVRAERRWKQRCEIGDLCTYEDVLRGLLERDRLDASRSVGPLAQASDATAIDTTELGIDEIVERIDQLVEEAR